MTTLLLPEIWTALGMTKRTFYRHKPDLERRGVLVELLPRFGRPRYFAQPVQDYITGRTRHQIVRQQLRGVA